MASLLVIHRTNEYTQLTMKVRTFANNQLSVVNIANSCIIQFMYWPPHKMTKYKNKLSEMSEWNGRRRIRPATAATAAAACKEESATKIFSTQRLRWYKTTNQVAVGYALLVKKSNTVRFLHNNNNSIWGLFEMSFGGQTRHLRQQYECTLYAYVCRYERTYGEPNKFAVCRYLQLNVWTPSDSFSRDNAHWLSPLS